MAFLAVETRATECENRENLERAAKENAERKLADVQELLRKARGQDGESIVLSFELMYFLGRLSITRNPEYNPNFMAEDRVWYKIESQAFFLLCGN